MKWSHRPPSCSLLTSLAAVTTSTESTSSAASFVSVAFRVPRVYNNYRSVRCRPTTTTPDSSCVNDGSEEGRPRAMPPIPSPYFTYTLGTPTPGSYSDTLYVPFTSYCQTRTLPQLRGPNFRLPPHVCAALCRVRDEELLTTTSTPTTTTCAATTKKKKKYDFWCKWLDTQESYQMLPPPLPEFCGTPPPPLVFDKSTDTVMVPHRPTVHELIQEVQQWYDYQTYIDTTTNDTTPSNTKSSNRHTKTIVIAGEGEPTLRYNELRLFTQQLHSFLYLKHTGTDDNGTSHLNTTTGTSTARTIPPTVQLRIMTNGLITTDQAHDLLQCCLQLNEPSTNIPPSFYFSIVWSVLLVSSDPVQYCEWMQPKCISDTLTLKTVQEFIRMIVNVISEQQKQLQLDPETSAATLNRMSIEITAIDRPDVDKHQLSELVTSLGVTTHIRWRPYFP